MQRPTRVTITVNGESITVPTGITVLEALKLAGIEIPSFCNHPRLEPIGACRMCLVEIEGMRGLQTACTTLVCEGMTVRTDTEEVRKAREANLEFLLTNHPLDCPVCDKGGECNLQDFVFRWGRGERRFREPQRRKAKAKPLSDFLILDQERCVLCWRCLRFLEEWAQDPELALWERGAQSYIDIFPGKPVRSKWQGNLVEVCPVGAITSRVFRFQARVWELSETESVCPLCSAGCNVKLGVKTNRLRRITPRENPAVNDIWLCDRGRFAHAFVDHPDRLKAPLIRRGDGWAEVSWDEALSFVARKLRSIAVKHGPGAVGGVGSPRLTTEANYLFQRFLRGVVGTANLDHRGRIPDSAAPLPSLPELAQVDAALLVGLDPSAEVPMVELYLKRAVRGRGARLLIVHPRRVELARFNGLWLPCPPGAESALVQALAYLALKRSQGEIPAEWAEAFEGFSAEGVAQGLGIPLEKLEEAAAILTEADKAVILYGASPVHRWGRGVPDALLNLAGASGAEGPYLVPEDNNAWGAYLAGVTPHLLPGGRPVEDEGARSRLSELWGAPIPAAGGLSLDEMAAAVREGSLKALVVMGADSLGWGADEPELLSRLELLVVQDLFLTPLAEKAHVVLPAAGFGEVEGTFVDLTGRVQKVRPALRPPGIAQPDAWIIRQLALRLAPSEQKPRWEGLARWEDVLAEMREAIPAWEKLDFTALEGRGWQVPLEKPLAFAPRRVEASAPSRERGEFRLVRGRLFYDRGTLLRRSEVIQRNVPEPYALLHPEDAEGIGVADGDEVTLRSVAASLTLKVRVDDGIAGGCVFVPDNLTEAPVDILGRDGDPVSVERKSA